MKHQLWACTFILVASGCTGTHTATKPSEVSIQNRDVIKTKFIPRPRPAATREATLPETGEPLALPEPGEAPPRIVSVAGHQIVVPADTVVEVEVEKIRSGTSRSASLRTDADEVAANFVQTQPPLMINGSSGGTASLTADLTLTGASGAQIVFWVAGIGLLVASAAAIFLLGNRPLGLTLGVSGGVVIVVGVLVESYPWVALLAVVAGLGVVVYLLWGDRLRGQYLKALTAVTGGIEGSPTAEAGVIKRSISERADAEDKRTILKVKNGTGSG